MPTDSSGTFSDILTSLFGPEWANAWTSGIGGPLAEMWTYLYTMYNGAIIAATCVVLLYAIYAGAVQTAQEGVPLGRHFSRWAPVRMAFGAALVTPINGICLVQIIVLWFAGIGNTIANNAARYITNYITTTTPLQPYPNFNAQIPEKKAFLAKALATAACTAYESKIGHTVQAEETDTGYKFVAGGLPIFNLGGSYCGRIEINTHETNIPLAKQAIGQIYNSFIPIGERIANNEDVSHYDVKPLLEQGMQVLQQFEETVTQQSNTAIFAEKENVIQSIQNDVNEYGWVALGSWYFFLAQTSDKYMLYKSVAYNNSELPEDQPKEQKEYILKALHLAKTAGYPADQDSKPSSGSIIVDFSHKIIDYIDNSGDPYITLYNIATEVGKYCMYGGGGAIASRLLLSRWLPGSKVTEVVNNGGWLLLAGGVLLIGMANLMILIPFGVWVMGVLSILISVVMSFFAAPLWGAAHCLPGGEGLLHQRSIQGYFGVMALVLRPFLAILGYVLAVFMLWGGARLVLVGLRSFLGTYTDGGTTSVLLVLLGVIIGFVFSVYIGLAVMYKSFEFIFNLGDHVLEWVGGGVRPLNTDPYATPRAVAGGLALLHMGKNYIRNLRSIVGSINKKPISSMKIKKG